MKTFLICPVRGHDPNETKEVVQLLERQGWNVHWPPRDTNQNDDTGLRICRDNRQAIQAADVVHVIWDGKSQGCLFDLGMAFAMGKPVYTLGLPKATGGKSFQNMVRAWEYESTPWYSLRDLVHAAEEAAQWLSEAYELIPDGIPFDDGSALDKLNSAILKVRASA